MTRNQIIKMSKDAGLWEGLGHYFSKELAQFVKLIAAAERRECERMLETLGCDHCAGAISKKGTK